MYSIVETAKANNLNVFQYLYTVLLYMPDYKNEPAGIEKLLPWSNFIKERCCRLIDVENQTPEPHEPLPISGEGYQGGSRQYGGLFIVYGGCLLSFLEYR